MWIASVASSMSACTDRFGLRYQCVQHRLVCELFEHRRSGISVLTFESAISIYPCQCRYEHRHHDIPPGCRPSDCELRDIRRRSPYPCISNMTVSLYHIPVYCPGNVGRKISSMSVVRLWSLAKNQDHERCGRQPASSKLHRYLGPPSPRHRDLTCTTRAS